MHPKLIITILAIIMWHTATAQDQRVAIDSLKQVLANSPEQKKADVYVALAAEYHHISGDTIVLYANKALLLAHKFKNKAAEAQAYTWLATAERDLGAYTNALAHYLAGLKIIEPTGNEEELIRIYNGIGITYKKMKRWDEALAYYRKSNTLAVKNDNYAAASHTYNNIGTIYLEKELWDTVVLYYDSAVLYAEKAQDNRAMSTVLFNLGDTYRAHKEYNKALNASLRCLKYDKLNEDKYGMLMSYFQIARIYEELKQNKQSLLYADSAEQIAIAEKFNRERIDILGWRSNVAENKGHFKEAFNLYRESRNIRDTLLNEATARQISELQTQYETEKKEQQIQLQKAEINERNYIIISISALSLLGLLLGYSFYNRYKQKQQDKLQKAIIQQQELATQAVIEAEEKERKRIAGDLHDGVGQTMSAAKMNLSAISHEIPFANDEQKLAFDKAMALVDEGCKEVRTVSHNIMPNALLKSGLANAIRDFVNKIDSKVLQVNLYTDGLNERLPGNIETVLYRVVQECVNNVIKHAGASHLDLTLIKDEDGISITIEDNGKGFDIDKAKDKDGIGLQNIITRIQYLKGIIEWDTAPGKGTVVTIQVPGVA